MVCENFNDLFVFFVVVCDCSFMCVVVWFGVL